MGSYESNNKDIRDWMENLSKGNLNLFSVVAIINIIPLGRYHAVCYGGKLGIGKTSELAAAMLMMQLMKVHCRTRQDFG